MKLPILILVLGLIQPCIGTANPDPKSLEVFASPNAPYSKAMLLSVYGSPKEPCSGGEPSPGPTCRCFVSIKTGEQRCFAKPGHISCDYDSDCGAVQPPGLFSSVPSLGLDTPSWHTFVF